MPGPNRFKRLDKKIVAFLKDHWIAVTVVFAVIVLTILSVIGFMGLESFYRKMQLSQLPIQIMMWILASAISAIIYVTLVRSCSADPKPTSRVWHMPIH